jgi:hypothetical protein
MSYLARLKAINREKLLPGKLPELTKGASVSFVSTQGEGFCRNEPNEAEILERAGMCADCVPAIYLDTWARLNHQKPMRVSEAEWRQMQDDGGRFLDRWGSKAEQWGWTAGDLFEVPREGQRGGLIWFLVGERVDAFGPEHCRAASGRIFDRRD